MRRWLIIFIHDGRPSVRVVRGSENTAISATLMVKVVYEDMEARYVELHDSHDDLQDLQAAYEEAR